MGFAWSGGCGRIGWDVVVFPQSVGDDVTGDRVADHGEELPVDGVRDCPSTSKRTFDDVVDGLGVFSAAVVLPVVVAGVLIVAGRLA